MFTKSFKSKIIIPNVIVLIGLVCALTFYSSYKFRTFNENLLADELVVTTSSLKDTIEGMKNDSLAAASAMALDKDVMAAMKEQDREKIITLLNPTISRLHITYYTVCDADGTVLARTHEPEKFGDSVLSQQNIKDALGGKMATYLEAGTAIKVSARTGAPVYDDDGTLVGVISAGVQFDSNGFVDDLKALYNVEATVFSGDERVATTIIQDGKRAIGTKLNPDIAKIVIDGQQEYSGAADILGVKYRTEYIPLIDANDKVFAIIFIGKSKQGIMTESNIFIWDGIVIGGIGLLLSIAVLVINVTTIGKPIIKLSEDLDNIANGNLGININIKSQDEIGRLGLSLQKVVSIIRKLLDDIDIMVRERENGDLDFFLNTEGFNGDYKKLADNILKLIDTSHNDTVNLLNILTEFDNGNFKADIPKQPGKKVIINQKVNMMRENMQSLSAEIVNLTSHAINGDLSARADSSHFNGDWKTIVNGLNQLLGAITDPIQGTINALGEMAKGNLHTKIEGDYKGDYATIKESVNTTAETISSYIDEISKVLNGLADNNLDQRITRNYVGDFADIGYSLNNILTNLSNVIEGIKSASDQVAISAKQMADTSTDLARGASDQASSIQELNATLIVVNEKTRENADNAKKAESLSNHSNENAVIGNKEMVKMLNAMNDVKESSNNISKIIKVIEDIAFQTNLLALNAAVEAARAGEHGKGFSVVAEEVRNLAARSQSAAHDTTALIESSIQTVTDGFRIAQATADALEKIVSNITEVSTIISEISGVSETQALSISQINEGVNQISQVIQSNSATSEESASASEELSSQSEMLNNMIQIFNLQKRR